jgi:hypothetical protein
MGTAASAHPASSYTLDRAYFASSTEWFVVENYPTPKKTDPKRSLIFRRFYAVYLDGELQTGTLANTISFVCQKQHLNSLLIHLPEAADIKTIRPRNQWISRTDVRILTDDFGAKFDAEYINGDFFIDFVPNDESLMTNLLGVLTSNTLTIEFGPETERIALYTGDTDSEGKANFKGFLRKVVPMMAKQFRGKLRIFSMSEMFKACGDYKRRKP